jgi:PilZ domain
MMSDERRSSQRKRILLEAKWESMSRAHEARVDDVSLGGCFVNTLGRVEPDEAVDLQIQLPSGEWLALQGRVATYQPGVGFGLSFTSLTEKETAALKELIATAKEKFI